MFKYEIEINEVYSSVIKEYANDSNFFSDDGIKYSDFCRTMVYARLSANGKNAFKKYYNITDKGLIQVRQPRRFGNYCESEVPKISNPYLTFDENFSGLYFLGNCGYNPITKETTFLAKIGSSENIGKRLKAYVTYNPLLYHNHSSLQVPSNILYKIEKVAHKFLDKHAYAKPSETNEWWYFTEENYLTMCEIFSNKEKFFQVLQETYKGE